MFCLIVLYRRTASSSNARRPIRIVPDWTENAVQGEHYWKPTSASGDLCCLNEECIVSISINRYVRVECGGFFFFLFVFFHFWHLTGLWDYM